MVWWRIGRTIMWSLMYYIAWVSNRPRFRNNNNKKSLKIRLRHTEDDKICGSPVCITVRPRFDWSLIAKVTFDSPDLSTPRIPVNHASVASRIFQKIRNRSKTSTFLTLTDTDYGGGKSWLASQCEGWSKISNSPPHTYITHYICHFCQVLKYWWF